MATSTQTDELGRNLSDNDLAALMSEICPISLSHVLAFGVQLQISGSKIEELRTRLHTHNDDKNDILLQILQGALKRELPLIRKEIITALQDPSVEENRLASQIQSRYRPLSQGDLQAPQSALFPQMPIYQPPHLTPLHPTSGSVPQILTNIQPPPCPNTSQLLTFQQLTTELPRTHQPQPNLDQVGQSHQLPASQRMSMTPQPGPQMQLWSQLQFPLHHPNYQHVPLQSHPGHFFPHPPNPPIHRHPESQSFPPYAPSHNQYSSLWPFHSYHSSVAQPPHDQYSQPFGNQSFTQLSQDQNILHPSYHTPYQQGQGHQSHQFQWQSSSQPPSQHHHSPVFPSQHFHTSDTNLPQTQESQSSPAPTFAATSESTPFLEPSPSPRQQPSPSPRQQPSLLSRQQLSFSPSHKPIPVSSAGSPAPPPAKRLRQQSPSPPSHYPPVSEATASTAGYPPHVHDFISPITYTDPPSAKRPRQHIFQYHSLPYYSSLAGATADNPPLVAPFIKPYSQQLPPLPISVSYTGSPMTYSVPPPAKRLRPQYPSPSFFHSCPASEALINAFIKFVKQKYSAQKVLKDEKWSLSPTVKFINLTCIDRKCVKSREYNDVTRAMVMDGNVDVIQEKKGPIMYSEIAKDISLPSSSSEQEDDRRLILVEGAPGVGKSTFAWEFCRKWMNGEIAQQYHLVLLLRLRDKRIREAKNLKDLLFNPSRPDESLAVYNELKHSHTFHALIILEGYDELPDICRNDPSSVFNELISGDSLPLATLLITSRPWATKHLRVEYACHIYQHIEVLGFTKRQIKEYINKNVGEERIISGLNLYLEKHPQIRSGMYIPLNSAIVVAVYKESIENDCQTLPNTITELYSCCIEILIRRHLNRNTGLQRGNEMNLPAINLCVPSDVHRNFVHMCHLAFSGIVEATEVKVIFSESELPKHFDNLGFMDSVTDLYVTGETVSSHNFLHLTFQEFFAAVHISTMSKEQQLQYFMEGKSDSGSKKGRLNVVLKFLAGLQKLDCVTKETASHIVNTPSSASSHLTPSEIGVGTDVVNWLFEAQSETAMSLILGEGKVEFKANKRHVTNGLLLSWFLYIPQPVPVGFATGK